MFTSQQLRNYFVLSDSDVIIIIKRHVLKVMHYTLCLLYRQEIELVLVPSYRDINHHFVYPQPPFSLPTSCKSAKVTCTSFSVESYPVSA